MNIYFKLFFPIVAFLMVSIETLGQCLPGTVNFLPGEKLNFKVYYNWGIIWVDAGEASFKADTARFGQEKVFQFTGIGKSLAKHDWFFRVNDKYQSLADYRTLQPKMFFRDVYEGGYTAKETYFFNHPRKKIFIDSNKSKVGAKKDSLALPDCLWDVQTCVYYVRTIDYSKFKPGDKFPLKMIVDGEIFNNLYIKIVGREKAKDDQGNIYNCLKFSAMLVEGTIFKGGEDVFVYVTDDQNKIPICIEAKILVGSVKVFLSSYSNLKYPVTALVSSSKKKK
jgi:hypothetical protein